VLKLVDPSPPTPKPAASRPLAVYVVVAALLFWLLVLSWLLALW
jgi:hypothetical protein